MSKVQPRATSECWEDKYIQYEGRDGDGCKTYFVHYHGRDVGTFQTWDEAANALRAHVNLNEEA